MIVDFRDRWLESFFVDDARSRHVPAELAERLFRRLQMLDDAASTLDLLVLPSNNFEQLRGKLAGLSSIRVNRNGV